MTDRWALDSPRCAIVTGMSSEHSRAMLLAPALLSAACAVAEPANSQVTSSTASTDESTDDAGDESQTETESDSESETGEPSDCALDLFNMCKYTAGQAKIDCHHACGSEAARSCEAEVCHWRCEPAYDQAVLDCQAQHCPSDPNPQLEWLELLPCFLSCYAELEACVQDSGCYGPDCSFLAINCLEACEPCQPAPVHYRAWAGSCVIDFPEPVSPLRRGYTTIITHGVGTPQFSVQDGQHVEPDICDVNSHVGGLWTDEGFQQIELCPAVCELYELHGAISLRMDPPPCE